MEIRLDITHITRTMHTSGCLTASGEGQTDTRRERGREDLTCALLLQCWILDRPFRSSSRDRVGRVVLCCVAREFFTIGQRERGYEEEQDRMGRADGHIFRYRAAQYGVSGVV